MDTQTILIQILLNLISSGILGTILVYFFQKKFTEQEHKFQIELEKEKNVIMENIKVIKEIWKKVITIDKNLSDAESLCYCIKSNKNRTRLYQDKEELKIRHHRMIELLKVYHHNTKEALKSLNEILYDMSPFVDRELRKEISLFLQYASDVNDVLFEIIDIDFNVLEFDEIFPKIKEMKLYKKNLENRINEYIVPN